MVKWAKETGKYFEPVEFHAVEVRKNMPPSWITPGLKEVPAFHHDQKDNRVQRMISDGQGWPKHKDAGDVTDFPANLTRSNFVNFSSATDAS